MIRVVIMCQGQQTRLPYLGIPKQLLQLPLCNETILDRTLRLLGEHPHVDEVVLIASEAVFEHLMGEGGDLATRHRALSREWKRHVMDRAAGEVPTFATQSVLYAHYAPRLRIEHVTLVNPGNSVIRGLQEIRACLAMEKAETNQTPYDRTVILLGDVVYSRRALRALVDPSPTEHVPSPIWWVVSDDLSPGGGEVFGMAYDRSATAEVLQLLDEVKHPPFEAYQPGQLRRLLWDWQSKTYGDDTTLPQWKEWMRSTPYRKCCYLTNDPQALRQPFDFTKDIDTEIDLMRIGQLDSAAFYDDHPEFATHVVHGGKAITLVNGSGGPIKLTHAGALTEDNTFTLVPANKEGE